DHEEWHAALHALEVRYQPVEVAESGRGEAWAGFDALKGADRVEARRRAETIAQVEAIEQALGWKRRTEAVHVVAREVGCGVSTLQKWIAQIRGVAASDRLPALVPGHGGGRPYATMDEQAWIWLRTDYLRPERPSVESCIRRLQEQAKREGWALLSTRTLKRRIEQIPEEIVVRARYGRDPAKRLYRAQERDRSHFHALEAVNADGHKWDVFVRWDDDTVSRPVMVAFQDLYSGMVLAWRIDQTESKDLVRLCFGDLIETWGIPEKCWLDNGRAFASKWLSGGTPNRYRFKVKDEEPEGILTALGVQIHWTMPYSGQSKPIERAFGDFARDIAKHPNFAGAWCGNDPLAKPENYASKAIPIAFFRKIVGEEIEKHNAREGRETRVCQGRLSFRAAFKESYERSLIRKAAPAQIHLCMLMGEMVTARKVDGSVHLLGNRYWHQDLIEFRGKRVTVRFDPGRLHEHLPVYRPDGRLICMAEIVEAAGFDDYEAAKRHQKARNAFLKATEARLAAERKMSIEELAAYYWRAERKGAETREPRKRKAVAKVIAPLFGVPKYPKEIKNFDELLRKGREKLRAAANSDLEE
ncbi:MAG: transposase domain-containing protein, partial [Acetobacteraceae bacterium]